MKFIAANKDADGYFNFQVQLDQTTALSPVKTFRYSPFSPRVGVKGDTEAQYIADIQAEIQASVTQMKAAWLAAGSPLAATWIPTTGSAPVNLAVAGQVI